MATRRKRGDGALDAPAPGLTTDQVDAVQAVHAYLDQQAASGPGAPDTPALREARALRTLLETAFAEAWPPPPSPIVSASF